MGREVKPEAVVFDIGNVLIGWQPERAYDRIVGAARRRALFAGVDLHGLNDVVDRGGDFAAAVAQAMRRHPEFAEELRYWRDHWIDLTGPVIDHSLRLLRALRQAGVPVFALSNFGVETFAIAEAHYPFLREFDQRYISGHMQTAKPDAQIYEMVEQACGVPPACLLFTDDRSENIAVAAARGWGTHLFDGAGGWAQCLVDHGLLTREQAV